MNIYNNQKVALLIQGSIQIKLTVPILFEYLNYEDEIGLIIEEPLLIKNFMLELQQIKELEQLINEKQPQQQSKARIIIEMIKLILEKNMINELNSVYVENEKLNYYFNKIGNKEGIRLLNQLASISIGWTIVKDNLQNTALLRQSKIPDQLILESIQFDKVNLTATLSKKLKKILKSQQVKMIHFSSHLEQSNEGIVRFLINNLSNSKFKKELVYEKPSNILCIIGKAHAQIQNSMKEKLKIIYLNEICQQMIVFPEILNELEINQGIVQVRNSYQLFAYFQKDPRLEIINSILQLRNLYDPFISAQQYFQILKKHIEAKFNLLYINQEILIYTIISHIKGNQTLVELQLQPIFKNREFQQFYIQLSQIQEGTVSRLIARCIQDIFNVTNDKSCDLYNTLITMQEGEENSRDNNKTIQNTKHNGQIQKILSYCLLNKIAIPEIFKYIQYSSKQLTIRSCKQFQLEMKEFSFINLNEVTLDKLGLLEQLVKMIKIIQFNYGQIEQNRLNSFLQIIPKLIMQFELFIQNLNEENFQDQNSKNNENKQYQDINNQLAKQAVRSLQEIQQISHNLPWQIQKKNYLIKILNHAVHIKKPLPQILGALNLVESELTLQIDKSLIKFLKVSGLYQYPNQYSHHLQENELICRLLDILCQEMINPDIQKELEEQLQSFEVRNLYNSLKELKLKKYLQYFNKLYDDQETYSKKNSIGRVYRKIKRIYLSYISENQILAPELVKQISLKKVKTNEETLKIYLNLNNQFIEDLVKNPALTNLNYQCQLSQLISKEVILKNYKNLNHFLNQQITQLQPQLEEKLILDAITILQQHQQSIVKDLHLVFQCGTFISTMDKLQDYFHSKVHSESQSLIKLIYQLLIQMNEFVNSNIQNDSKLIENSEFNQSLINYSANDKIVVNKLFKQSLNRNTRKMLQYMIKKQVVFPELINFLHIIDTSKTQRLQFKKRIEFVNFLENNREIQQFMNICVNGENSPPQKIKLTDFEILPQIKVIDTCMDEVEEQSSIINILQILFNQKEMHIDALKFIFQQSTVQSLIQDMKLIYAQRPHKRKQLLKAYQIMYDLNYWIQNIQLEENQNYEFQKEENSESQQKYQLYIYIYIKLLKSACVIFQD